MSYVDLRRYLLIAWKWLWLIAICTAIAAGGSYYASKSMLATYRASITLLVGEDTTNPNVRPDEVSTSQRLADAYAGMVRRQPVMAGTVEALGLQMSWRELQDQVLSVHVAGSQFIEIRATDTDPERAKAIADQVARQLTLQSPTAENMRQLEERQQFTRQQLDALQASIQQAEASIAERQAGLKKETSARGVLDLQDEIEAIQINLTDWRTTYAALLSSYQPKGPNTLTVIEPAYVPTEPVSPNMRANVLMASAVGLLLALAAVLLIEYMNDTLGTPEDVEQALAVPTLASIQDMGRIRSLPEALIAARAPRSPISEAYRLLRTNVQFASVDSDSAVLLITSPALQEGKSITCANLAASFAQAGSQTVLVDADLRRPCLHSLFGHTNEVGLTSLFLNEPVRETDQPVEGHASGPRNKGGRKVSELKRRLEACLVPTDVPGLRVLLSGPMPVNPAELLGSSRMGELLRSLEAIADVVIMDTPPVLPVADTAILAGRGASVVLVVEARKTRGSAARAAKETLLRANARILGVVLNRLPKPSLAYYRYSYYHYGAEPSRHRPVLAFLRRGPKRQALQ